MPGNNSRYSREVHDIVYMLRNLQPAHSVMDRIQAIVDERDALMAKLIQGRDGGDTIPTESTPGNQSDYAEGMTARQEFMNDKLHAEGTPTRVLLRRERDMAIEILQELHGILYDVSLPFGVPFPEFYNMPVDLYRRLEDDKTTIKALREKVERQQYTINAISLALNDSLNPKAE